MYLLVFGFLFHEVFVFACFSFRSSVFLFNLSELFNPGFESLGAQSLSRCATVCHPMDYIWPGSSVPGIFQARILEWVAISYSIESFGCMLKIFSFLWLVFIILSFFEIQLIYNVVLASGVQISLVSWWMKGLDFTIVKFITFFPCGLFFLYLT